MKNREYSDMYILLVVGLVLSLSFGIVYFPLSHTDQSQHAAQSTSKGLCCGLLLDKDVLDFLEPFMLARGLDVTKNNSNKCASQDVCEVASIIAHDKRCPLALHEKRALLLTFAGNYSYNKLVQYKIFDLMAESKLFQTELPLLLDVVRNNHAVLLPSLLSWIKLEKTKKHVKYFGRKITSDILIEEALLAAVLANNFHDLETLNSSGIRISSQQASTLLAHVVYERKDPIFIPFLIKRGANIHSLGPDKNTLLTKAIINQDTIAVQALLECGADLHKHNSAAIGSAFAIAQKNCNQEIKALLDVYNQNI